MDRITIVLIACWASGCGGGSTDPVDAGTADAGSDAGPADAAPAYVAGDPVVLTEGAGNDEDPAVIRARDGTIYVAWYSNAGNDIMIRRTTDGVTWTPPAHVSTGAATDFAPSLYQDAAGGFHATWFRWGPAGKIIYNHSADGLSWNPADEVEVTTATATDDWVPSITADAAGTLVIAFARNTCPPPTCYGIAVTTSTDGATWTAPVYAATAGAGVEHHLPAIANVGGELQLAWDPFDEAAPVPWQNASTGAHIVLATSTTGATWTDLREVTPRDPTAVSLFPTWFADHTGAWHVAWLAADAGGGGGVVEVPLAALATPPAALPITGYSPKLVATPTAGLYLGAWVEGPLDQRDIVVRVFAH